MINIKLPVSLFYIWFCRIGYLYCGFFPLLGVTLPLLNFLLPEPEIKFIMKPARFFILLSVIIAGVFMLTYSSCKKDGPCPPTVTWQGQTYNTVLIGDQCWFKENLNYATGNSWCYDNDHAKCATYGRLYDWETALGVCPSGWHIPTDVEWTTLTNYLGGESVAGGKMKEAGYAHWLSPNTGATNTSGFTALPGGYRSYHGYFYNLTEKANFWSSTESTSAGAWYQYLFYDHDDVYRYSYSKTSGGSARCLKD